MYSNYTVYADLLFLLNFFLDFFLLWASGRFLRRRTRYVRLLLGAVLGALYGVGLVLPELAFFYSFAMKIVFSLLMLAVAYPFSSPADFLRLTVVFYLIGFAMAGAAMGGSSLLAGAGIHLDTRELVGGASLLFALFTAILLAKKGLNKWKAAHYKEDFQIRLEIAVEGHSCILPALIDTGNNLADPLSGRPVIVCEYRLLLKLLPLGVRRAVERYGLQDPAKIISETARAGAGGWEKRLRLVPFISIGQNHGLLLGFRPDYIVLHGLEKHQTDQVIIGFYGEKLSREADYGAIINPDVFADGKQEKREASA